MKAIVLCAGYGTRLGELTKEIPKPMLLIEGHPLLAYILGHLQRHGFKEVGINLHFKPELIRDYFGDGAKQNMKLAYTYEPELLGTAGGVKNLEHFLTGEAEFLVQYGDVITDQDFSAMLRFHRAKAAIATLLVHHRIKSNSIVNLDSEGRIVSFLERPTEEARCGQKSPWVNSGICICSSELLALIPENSVCDLPRDIFSKLVSTGRLYGFPLTGFRCAVDSANRLAQARTEFSNRHCFIQPLVPSLGENCV
jgi:mannose-1-phosphate guanylyltransferase/phosphomannomutase